jgi:hypothetical protein
MAIGKNFAGLSLHILIFGVFGVLAFWVGFALLLWLRYTNYFEVRE